jgi:hypothetical protein
MGGRDGHEHQGKQRMLTTGSDWAELVWGHPAKVRWSATAAGGHTNFQQEGGRFGVLVGRGRRGGGGGVTTRENGAMAGALAGNATGGELLLELGWSGWRTGGREETTLSRG